MKIGKKIAVGLAAALAIAMFAAGAVSMVGAQVTAEFEFTVDVRALNVHIEKIHATEFGEMSPEDVTEMHSFDVANDGDMDAMMSANFLTGDGEVYGFTGGSVIPAEHFRINDIALNNNGDAKEIDVVVSGETKECHTKLLMPPGTPGDDYLGSLELIFTPATRQP